MRYTLTFLGLIASTSALASPNPIASPDTTTTTTTTTTDPCKNVIQTIMKPLAKDPWAKKFCAAKFPCQTISTRDVDDIALEAELEKRGTPLWQQLGVAEKDVLETFCKCNYGLSSGGGSGGAARGGGCGSARKYRGRVRRYPAAEEE